VQRLIQSHPLGHRATAGRHATPAGDLGSSETVTKVTDSDDLSNLHEAKNGAKEADVVVLMAGLVATSSSGTGRQGMIAALGPRGSDRSGGCCDVALDHRAPPTLGRSCFDAGRLGFMRSRVRIPHPAPLPPEESLSLDLDLLPGRSGLSFGLVSVRRTRAIPCPDEAAHPGSHVSPNGIGDVLIAGSPFRCSTTPSCP
jgi:hypothetical protein